MSQSNPQGAFGSTTPAETQAAVAAKLNTAAQAKGRAAVRALTLEHLAVEYVPIDSIYPNDYNPNRQDEGDFELLCRSIEEDGFTTAVLCQRKTRKIIDGEHRWRAAHVLGMTEIPVVFTDMTAEQMRVSTIRHNRARGTHDAELEAKVLRDLQQLGALDWAQDALMLDDSELNRLLADVPAPEALSDPEYTEAWVPSKNAKAEDAAIQAGDPALVNAQVVYADTDKGTMVQAMTAQAVTSQQEQRARMQNATSEAERIEVRREQIAFRVNLSFTNDEAEVVQAALGDKPAETLLALCTAWVAQHG